MATITTLSYIINSLTQKSKTVWQRGRFGAKKPTSRSNSVQKEQRKPKNNGIVKKIYGKLCQDFVPVSPLFELLFKFAKHSTNISFEFLRSTLFSMLRTLSFLFFTIIGGLENIAGSWVLFFLMSLAKCFCQVKVKISIEIVDTPLLCAILLNYACTTKLLWNSICEHL